jgi:hypothetical protein
LSRHLRRIPQESFLFFKAVKVLCSFYFYIIVVIRGRNEAAADRKDALSVWKGKGRGWKDEERN